MIDGLVETGKVAAISYYIYQMLSISIRQWRIATDLQLSLREDGVGLRRINRAGECYWVKMGAIAIPADE